MKNVYIEGKWHLQGGQGGGQGGKEVGREEG